MKVLVVDDCGIFIQLFKYTLSQIDAVKVTLFAKNGKQAMFHVNSTQFDLVILDLEMPIMDGFEVIPLIKEKSPETKIIVCSGLTRFNYESIQRVLALGADGVTSKLFQRDLSHELSMDHFRNELVPRIMNIYEQKNIESYEDIVEHSYAKNIIDGILVIHLLEKNRENPIFYGWDNEFSFHNWSIRF
jgi:DNA-binding NarL/FixJ family response regulator